MNSPPASRALGSPRPGRGKRSVDLSTRTKNIKPPASPKTPLRSRRSEADIQNIHDILQAGGDETEFEIFDAEVRNKRKLAEQDPSTSLLENLEEQIAADLSQEEITEKAAPRATGAHRKFSSHFGRQSIKKSSWKVPNLERRQSQKELKKEKKKELSAQLCTECNKGQNTYLAAAKNNHSECLYALQMKDKHHVKDAPPMDVRDGFGATALHYAARSGNLDMVQWLIENNIDIHVEARNGALPVHDAAATGNLNCLQCFVFHDEKITQNCLNDNEILPIHLAAMFGRTEVVRWLLELKHNAPADLAGNGSSILHYAAQGGHVPTVAFLTTAHGKNLLELKNNGGATPLYRACEEGKEDVVRFLLEEGADASVTIDELKPIHIAGRLGHTGVVQVLLKHNPEAFHDATEDGATVFHFAAAAGSLDTLQFLLDERARRPPTEVLRSWTDNFGCTPVHDAAGMGQLDALKLMAERGIYLGAKNDDGLSPADLARDASFPECAIFLTLKSK
eukprot:m.48433 g.48433  ORF g.48433 m.48433 type:complete len:508 (-) comp17792_c2_seq1:53-1576(-)